MTRCKYCNEVIMGDFHKEKDCAMKITKNHRFLVVPRKRCLS